MSQLNQSTRQEVFDRRGHECIFCGVTGEQHKQEYDRDLDVHHVIPSSKGGSDDPENLIPLCIGCHRTIEATQGEALGRIAEKETDTKELERLRSELEETKAQLTTLQHNPIQEIDATSDDILRYMRRDNSYKSVDIEVVSETIGTRAHVYTDEEKARNAYEDWGSAIRKDRVSLPDGMMIQIIEQVLEQLRTMNRETEELK